MSNFNKLKEMWENKNKQEQPPPPPIKPASFKSTFQPSKINNSNQENSKNNHFSLPQNFIKAKTDISNNNKSSNTTNIESQQIKSPSSSNQQNQVALKNLHIQQKPIKKIDQKQIKESNQNKGPFIVKDQIQRPKTMIPQKKQEPKINKIAQMRNMFENRQVMGFQLNQPVKNHKPQQNLQQNNEIFYKNNNNNKGQSGPKIQVQYQRNVMSFQQRRKMAQNMLKNKQQVQKNLHEKHKIIEQTNKTEENLNTNKQQQLDKKQVIHVRLSEQVYYYDEESRQAARQADILSQNIFTSALNKKPFYETNQGSINVKSQQNQSSVNQTQVTNLEVRKPKGKKRNLEDFDDA